jgi:hypothetical protein
MRLVANLAGSRVGAIATRHQLLITHPILVSNPVPIARGSIASRRPADGGW